MTHTYSLPISIIVAGAFIGFGLAYSGTFQEEASPQSSVPQESAPQERGEQEVDSIDVVANIEDYQFLGDPEAPVTIIEYADYACPFCHRHWRETLPDLKENYVDEGLVRFAYRDFPVVGGEKAAEASHCAAEQGAYWEYHDLLYERHEQDRGKWSDPEVHREYARELGLDEEALVTCFTEERYASLVEASLQEAVQNQGMGTPYFLVNGIPVGGAQPFEVFEEVIGIALEKAQ